MYSGPVIDCDVHHARSTDAELIPYLCSKDAAAAMEFYKKAFGAKEVIRLTGPEEKSVMPRSESATRLSSSPMSSPISMRSARRPSAALR